MYSGAFGQGRSCLGKMGNYLLVVLLAGCGAVSDARFSGSVTATEGVCGLGFDAAGRARATLVTRGDDVRFAPSDGVIVLSGKMNAAGHVVVGSTAAGADKKPFAQVFEGDLAGDYVSGVYATPRCRAKVDLNRR